jgi:hypothetical protein
MRVKKVGILNENQLIGNNALKTINDYGLQCFSSDLSRIMGNQYDGQGYGTYCINGTNTTNSKKEGIRYIGSDGKVSTIYSRGSQMGVRICISFDDIEDFDLENVYDLNIEYPLTAISGMVGKTIDRLFNEKSKLIIKTGRSHEIDGNSYDEYEVFGIRFIKMENKTDSKVLSDGTSTERNKEVYLQVEKIPFIVDEDAKVIYSTSILFSTNFANKGKDYTSELVKILNGNFLKSINDELEHKEPCIFFDEPEEIRKNRYGFDFSDLTEEEIVEICINSNIAVFLHGKTGTGKTERMLTLDRDLELIDFGCTSSDGFTGIVAKDFNSKELFLYEPYWYKNLCKKCKEAPDKLHILFLEELTNAKSDIQKVAFEVTLNKTLTNSGFRLKLPENAVVCAAGNEASESRSANAMSEPLFGRFAHVYIDTDSEEWLKWALKRKKAGKELLYKKQEEIDTIHPAIVDFIRVNGDNVLRTQYNGVTPNADPRKWALASKALYKSNNPNVLRAFVGEEVTKSFIEFCKMNLITIDDVLNDRCKVESISFDPSLRWYTTMCLSTVDDENVDKVRQFVSGLGKEFLAVFDYEWSKGNDARIMKLYTQSDRPFVKRLIPNGNK